MLSLAILRNRDFRVLLLTRLFGTTALQAQAVIVGWQIYSLTKSPFMLGLVGLTEAVPAIICAFIAGHIVDNGKPYFIFKACVGALALNMLSLYLIGGNVITVPGGNIVPYIFAGVFLSGLIRSFIIPSGFALQPQILSREQMPAASAWLTSCFQIGIIGGPALAGLIYGGYGPHIAWLFPVILMTCEFFAVLSISKNHHHFKSPNIREPIVKSIRLGWRFIWKNHILLAVMALDMFAVLFGGAVAMLPAYADQVLHTGSEGLGILRASPALGAVVVTLFFALYPMKNIKASLLLWMVAGFGFCIIGFGFSRIFWVSLLFLALSGAFDSVSMVIRQTLVQWLTPANMRGRVSSVNSMFVISSNEIGAFESGVAARFLGLVPSVIFGGIGTLAVVAITALAFPKLRKLVINANDTNK